MARFQFRIRAAHSRHVRGALSPGACRVITLYARHPVDWRRPKEAQMDSARPLYIPVILGTPRRGRFSAQVARFVAGELAKRDEVETELIDICSLPFPIDGA